MLIFVMSNAYAGITWLEDTITGTDLPVASWVTLSGTNGISARTWGGTVPGPGYEYRCADSAENAMSVTGGAYHGPTPDVWVNISGYPLNLNQWVEAHQVIMEIRRPSNNSFTLYCLLGSSTGSYNTLPEEIKNSDNIGVIYHVNISSVVLPVLSTTGSLELGNVRHDETVTKTVPLSMSYAGGGDGSKTISGKVSWVITPATGNPSSLMPVIRKGGVPVESFIVNLTNTQLQNDDFTVSLTGNEYPGEYSWVMNITTAIE